MATKRIIDLPQIDTGDIAADKVMPVDDIITEKITLQQLADWIVAQVPPSSGGGSPITAVQQNVVNEKAGFPAIAIENAAHDSYTDNKNIVYTLAQNYAQGATSIELTCTSPVSTFKPIYPMRIIIYDGTNKSYGVITGFTSGTNYTLAAALVNQNDAQVAYSTSGTVVKLRMKAHQYGKGTVPSGLTGQALAAPEDLLVKYLTDTITAGKVTAFREIFSEYFAVAGLPSSTSTEVTSATDKSTVFPSGAKFVCFHMKDNGTILESIENGTFGKNFSIFTCSDTSTYGSGKITLNHSAKANTGIAADGTYYIAKLPTTKILVEDDSVAGTPLEVEPTSVIPKGGTILPAATQFAILMKDPNNQAKDETGVYNFTKTGTLTNTVVNGVNFLSGFSGSNTLKFTNYTGVSPFAVVGTNHKMTMLAYGIFQRNGAYQRILEIGNANYQPYYGYTSGNDCGFVCGGVFSALIPAATMVSFEDGAPHLLSCVYDYTQANNMTRTYMDAVNYVSSFNSNVSWTGSTENPAIGTNSAGGEAWAGKLGGVIYLKDYGMSATEIANFYAMVKTYGWNMATLVLMFELENQTGNKVTIATPTEIAASSLENNFDLGTGFIIQ